MFTIYAILNLNNDKIYIGSTKDFHKRKLRHLNELRKNKHHNAYLQRSFNKHGESSFDFISLYTGDTATENQFDTEERFILEYKPEYNIGSVGGGDNISSHPDKDSILKRRSETYKARAASLTAEERKAKWGKKGEDNPNWGGGSSKSYCTCGKEKALTAKSCIKCTDRSGDKNPFHGKQHSEETKQKLRKSAKQRVLDWESGKEVNSQAKRVFAEGKVYYSLSACARAYGKVPATILNRVRSKNFPDFYYLD